MRQAAFFSDNNYQDYEFTRLNTYEKKEMSEEFPKIGSNNNYWTEGSDAFFNNEYFEYDEFIQYTMHPRVQRIKTNAECSHSIPFVAACGIRKIHLLAAW